MKPLNFAAIATLLFTSGALAAAPDCASGYKNFVMKVSPYIERVDPADLPEFMRRGLSAFDACMAGDSFTPHGVWDGLAAEMEVKSKK